ncbi:Putative L-lactate dehydrogenase (plasmid) [Rhodococcus ruber]|uniref:alpha-hydroxy acid oxidase n=1 Tax=Rhodococcus ruber TaxID=1830 RepID=UPI00315DFC0C
MTASEMVAGQPENVDASAAPAPPTVDSPSANRSRPDGSDAPVRRQFPRWSEIRPLLSLKGADSALPRGLRGAHTVSDVRAAARRAVPRPVFDFVDGGAEDEVTMNRSRDAFRQIEFMPRALTGIEAVDTSVTMLGRTASLPLVLAPTGFARLSHRTGEIGAARAAGAAGVPYTLSTFGTISIEELAAAAPDTDLWFQLYVLRDRELTASLVRRAFDAGYSTLVVTVDSVATGKRVRDLRNGLSIPPKLTPKTVTTFAAKPRWALDMVTSPQLDLASLRSGSGKDLWTYLRELADPTFSYADIPTLRELWPGSLVLKGVLTVDDARAALDHGVDGIVLSNHGGRQLDRIPIGIELLPQVLDAVGDALEVYVDGGVRSGADLVAARGLGATGSLAGRPYLYGLMAAGQRGVQHVLDIYAREAELTLKLVGSRNMHGVTKELVRMRAGS